MISLRLIALLGTIALTACGQTDASDGEATTDAATRVACRERADQIYNQQNRATIYSPMEAVNTPSSAGYAPGDNSRGLSDLFAHDRMVSDCVRNTGTQSERSEAPVAPAPAIPHP